MRHVRRAQQAVLTAWSATAGACGQTGWANPLAFMRAVREHYDGIVVLAGGVSDGAGILAAQVLGADLAYLGTRFIATAESLASPEYRAAVLAATMDDITTTTQLTGLAANALTAWLDAAVPSLTARERRPLALMARRAGSPWIGCSPAGGVWEPATRPRKPPRAQRRRSGRSARKRAAGRARPADRDGAATGAAPLLAANADDVRLMPGGH